MTLVTCLLFQEQNVTRLYDMCDVFAVSGAERDAAVCDVCDVFAVSGAERDAAVCDVCDVFLVSGAERDAAAGEERPVPAAAV